MSNLVCRMCGHPVRGHHPIKGCLDCPCQHQHSAYDAVEESKFKPKQHRKWEYLQIITDSTNTINDDQMGEIGGKGWEFVQCVVVRAEILWIFKREVK